MVVLSFVATLVLIKALFGSYEWGSVTDTLSAIGSLVGAIGTVATFWIAFKAFEKVPDWMAQKHYDIAYSIIENAIYKDLADVRLKSLHTKNLILKLTKRMVDSVRDDGADENINRQIEQLNQALDLQIDEFYRSAYGIINQLKSVLRTDYKLSQYALEIESFIQSSYKEYNSIYNGTFVALGEYQTHYFADQKAKDIFEKELSAIRHDAVKNNKYLSDKINQVYSQNLPIEDFIIRKKK